MAAILDFPTLVDFPKFFHCGIFLPTYLGLHLHNNYVDTARPANSPMLNPHLHDYTIAISNTYVYAVVYTFTIFWHIYLVNNLLIVVLYIACWVCQWKNFEILSIFDKDMDISVMSPLYRLALFCPKLWTPPVQKRCFTQMQLLGFHELLCVLFQENTSCNPPPTVRGGSFGSRRSIPRKTPTLFDDYIPELTTC